MTLVTKLGHMQKKIGGKIEVVGVGESRDGNGLSSKPHSAACQNVRYTIITVNVSIDNIKLNLDFCSYFLFKHSIISMNCLVVIFTGYSLNMVHTPLVV